MAVGDRRLGKHVRARMESTDTALVVSAVIAFEYADLQERGRFPHQVPLQVLLDQFSISVFDLPADAWRLASSLPTIHQDPVDRMLVAHAIMTGLPIASADACIGDYPVTVVW